MHTIKFITCSTLLSAATALAGCRPPVDATPALDAAGKLISEAEQSGAFEPSIHDLARARELLSDARYAQSRGRDVRATRLAEEASIEARLALARTSAERAARALESE